MAVAVATAGNGSRGGDYWGSVPEAETLWWWLCPCGPHPLWPLASQPLIPSTPQPLCHCAHASLPVAVAMAVPVPVFVPVALFPCASVPLCPCSPVPAPAALTVHLLVLTHVSVLVPLPLRQYLCLRL